MTPAGPPPPAGVIFVPATISPFTPQHCPAAQYRSSFAGGHGADMQSSHRCHSPFALHKSGVHAYVQNIDREAPSSSQRSRDGLAALLLPLPIRTGNARRISSPGGRCFFPLASSVFFAVIRDFAGRCSRVARRSRASERQEEECKTRMGAMQHRLCFENTNRLYSPP